MIEGVVVTHMNARNVIFILKSDINTFSLCFVLKEIAID